MIRLFKKLSPKLGECLKNNLMTEHEDIGRSILQILALQNKFKSSVVAFTITRMLAAQNRTKWRRFSKIITTSKKLIRKGWNRFLKKLQLIRRRITLIKYKRINTRCIIQSCLKKFRNFVNLVFSSLISEKHNFSFGSRKRRRSNAKRDFRQFSFQRPQILQTAARQIRRLATNHARPALFDGFYLARNSSALGQCCNWSRTRSCKNLLQGQITDSNYDLDNFGHFEYIRDILRHFLMFLRFFRHLGKISRHFDTFIRFFDISGHFLTFRNIIWHFGTFFDISGDFWHFGTLFDILGHFLKFRNIIWHFGTFFDISRHFLTFINILWDT